MDPTQYQGGVSQKQLFRPEKAEDWEPYRDIIAELYAEMTLTKVMEEMETLYRFSGTRKQYKTKIRDWGLTNKYIKKDEYESLINQGQKAVYDVRGKRVTHSDVERFKRRQEKISEEKKHSKDHSKRKVHGATAMTTTTTTAASGSSGSHHHHHHHRSSHATHGTSSGNHHSRSNLSLGYYDDNAGEGPSGGGVAGGFSMPGVVPVATTTAGGYVTFPAVGAAAGSTAGGYVVPGPADYATMGFYGDGSAGLYSSAQQPGGAAGGGGGGGGGTAVADMLYSPDFQDPTQPGTNPHGHGGWY